MRDLPVDDGGSGTSESSEDEKTLEEQNDADYQPNGKSTEPITETKPGSRPWPRTVDGTVLKWLHDSRVGDAKRVPDKVRKVLEKLKVDHQVSRADADTLWLMLINFEKDTIDWKNEREVLAHFKEEWPEMAKDIKGKA